MREPHLEVAVALAAVVVLKPMKRNEIDPFAFSTFFVPLSRAFFFAAEVRRNNAGISSANESLELSQLTKFASGNFRFSPMLLLANFCSSKLREKSNFTVIAGTEIHW